MGTPDAPPPGSRAAEFTDERLATMSANDLDALVADVADDEPALIRVIDYMDCLEAGQRQWAQWEGDYEQRAQAERDAAHADWSRWEAEQTAAGLGDPALRPAKRPRRRLNAAQEVREEYDTFTHLAYLRAEDDCCGVLLNKAGRRAGIDPHGLFSGPYSRVAKWGSEELRSWFGNHGRLTLVEFRYQALHRDSDRKTAELARLNHHDEWN